MTGYRSPFEIREKTAFSRVMACADVTHPHKLVAKQEVSIHRCDEIAARFAALEQGVRDVLIQQLKSLNQVFTQHQTRIEAQQDVALDQAQSSGMSVSQPDLHRKMLARVTEFGGDHEKLLPKYQQVTELDQPGEFRQELKDRVADSLRERCARALEGQLNVDYCDDERKTEQIAHATVAQDEVCDGTLLTRGKPRTWAIWRLEKCDVRIMSWEVRVIQLEALVVVRECRPKLVARLMYACMVDDAEDELDEEIVLDACLFLHRTAIIGSSPLRIPVKS